VRWTLLQTAATLDGFGPIAGLGYAVNGGAYEKIPSVIGIGEGKLAFAVQEQPTSFISFVECHKLAGPSPDFSWVVRQAAQD
jgi:hypothetical protein